MINTIFHFVNDPTFDYQTAVNNGDISEYTIVFNSADHSIRCKGAMFGRMSRADMAETLGNISDLIPVATDSTLGGIKIGYTNDSDQNSRRYGVVLDSNNKAYVEVPWSDTITPDYDDSAVKALIATERNRIDNFISTLSSTIDAKNRELYADAQWVNEVFGDPAAQGTVAHAFRNEVDNYLNQYSIWDWVDPNDHSQGRTAKISAIEQDVDHITSRVGATEERLDNADGEGVTIETFVSTIKQTANNIDAHVGRVETKADANTDAIQSTNVAVSNLELSVNGFYKVDIVNAPSPDTSVNISTISAQLSGRTTALVDDEELNGKLFTTAPTENIIYKKGSQYFKLIKIKGAVESLAGLTASVSEYEGNMDDLVTIVASTLLLKANKTDSGYITTSDLASVIANGRYNAYAGLNETVSDIAGDLSNLSSSVVLSSNLNTELSNCTAFTNLLTTVNGITGISTAQANLLATIDENDWAGFMATVTKDSTTNPATYDTTAKVHANKIILDGTTFAGTIFSDLVNTTTLLTNYATITNLNAATARITDLEADNVTINNELTAAKATFTGELIGATGSFSGEVSASEFVAGNDINGFSINIVPLAFLFNWKGTPLAWFSLCGWDETNNTFATPTTDPKGFYLYMRSPVDGHMITIDFANLTFKDLNANSNPVYTYPLYSITRLNGNVANDPVISQDRDVYYTDVNNTKTWYSNSKGTTALSSVSGYRKASIDYSQGPNNGSPMLNPYVLKQRGSTGPYDLVKADIYIGQTFSGGQVVDDTSKIVVVVMDTDGHYKICTPISGNPKSVSGASNVYYQGVLSNNFAGGHRDIGSSSTSVSAYVVNLASTTGNIYSGNSVTYFDNNNHTTSMLATTYPAA